MRSNRSSRLAVVFFLCLSLGMLSAPLLAQPSTAERATGVSLWRVVAGWLETLWPGAAGTELNEVPWAEPSGRQANSSGGTELNEVPWLEPNGRQANSSGGNELNEVPLLEPSGRPANNPGSAVLNETPLLNPFG